MSAKYIFVINLMGGESLKRAHSRCFPDDDLHIALHVYVSRISKFSILLYNISNTEGDREPIIVNISHEAKSVGNSEAAIWQWMCLIG